MKAELSKHTLNLFPGDYAKLQEFFPDTGAATIIRRIVHAFITEIEERGEPTDEAEIQVKL
jgi:hypothetical protein